TFSGVKIKYNIDKCTDVSLVFRCDTDYFYFDIELFLENGKICVGNGRFEVFKSDKSVSFDGFREIYRKNINEFNLETEKIENFFKKLYENVIYNLDNNIVDKVGYEQGLQVNKIISQAVLKF
ncbi:MAG: hypothetical protein WC337_11155, partial [Candidatus Muiribacteriota bacterium]